MEAPDATFVAVEDDAVMGTYYLRTNQPGLGSHVCNAGYIVGKAARRRGLGRAMCAHSLDEARRRGFRAMQYNLVVVTNEGAVRLWKEMGFAVVGTVPGGFNHKELGYVDAQIMYQEL